MKKYLDIVYYNKKEIIIVIVMLLGFISFNTFNNKEEPMIVENITEEQKEKEEAIVIDIKGEVNNPGSYEIEYGKRIKDAIELAGGLKDTADIESINLSEKLQDEMLIVIPNKKKQKEEQEVKYEVKDSKISINNATVNELMKISGIGKSKAQSIVDYRNQNGRFNKLEDITKVSGIGKKTFEKIKDYIKL